MTTKGHDGSFRVMENLYVLIVVVVTQLYISVKIHRPVYQRRANFTICKLYLNLPDFNERICMKCLFHLPLKFGNRKLFCTIWIPKRIVTCRKSQTITYSIAKIKLLPEFTNICFCIF